MFAPPELLAAAPLAADPQEKKVSSWFDKHGESLVVTPLRIVAIIVVALVLRAITRKLISQLIGRMANSGNDGSGRPVTGFLLNAERRRQRAETVGSVLRSIASFVIMGIAALTVLGEFSIDLAPLLASAGIAGVAIGFGARNLVTDFLSGMFMILEDQYGVGDLVDAGQASGTVMEVGLRITKLRDADGTVWYIRNGEVKRVGNKSQGWGTARVDLQVGYREDVDKVRGLIGDAADAMGEQEPWSEVMWGGAEISGVEQVTPESYVLQARVRTMPGQDARVACELRARLKRAFDDAGVRLSDVVVQDTGPAPSPAQAASSQASDGGADSDGGPDRPPSGPGQGAGSAG